MPRDGGGERARGGREEVNEWVDWDKEGDASEDGEEEEQDDEGWF